MSLGYHLYSFWKTHFFILGVILLVLILAGVEPHYNKYVEWTLTYVANFLRSLNIAAMQGIYCVSAQKDKHNKNVGGKRGRGWRPHAVWSATSLPRWVPANYMKTVRMVCEIKCRRTWKNMREKRMGRRSAVIIVFTVAFTSSSSMNPIGQHDTLTDVVIFNKSCRDNQTMLFKPVLWCFDHNLFLVKVVNSNSSKWCAVGLLYYESAIIVVKFLTKQPW